MAMQAPNQMMSEAKARWGQLTYYTLRESCEVIIDDQPTKSPQCPPLESLSRRYEASDKTWVEGWLEDEVDPCSPE